MPSNALRAALLGAVLALMLPPAANAPAVDVVANDAAQSIADRYADATDADDTASTAASARPAHDRL